MKYTLLITALILSSYLHAQISIELNSRSSKIDTVFDYYAGIEVKDSILNVFEGVIYGSYERDRGACYVQYKGSLSHKHFKISHVTDTENETRITSANIFLNKSFSKVNVKYGLDVSYTDELLAGAYLAVKYKFISFETAFNGTFYKMNYSINPTIKLTNSMSIGIISKGLLVEGNFKWRNGINLKLEI